MVFLAALGWAGRWGAPAAAAVALTDGVRAAHAASTQGPSGYEQRTGAETAPSAPPLSANEASSSETVAGEEVAGGTPQTEADPLVSNGLGSPSCKGGLSDELSASARHNCETSGFAAAPAPTGDYGIDVHIDTSALNPTSWGSTIVQDWFVAPLWMALVWAVHALVVMLEWSFTVDVLDSASTMGVGGALRQMQATITDPWLPLALAAASVLALYHGLVRRRVADTLGEALLMGVMMSAGIWVLTNPTGTVGALGEWANQASLGTLAIAARGNPSSPGRAFGSSLETVFVAAIEVPWCYLEFGDVGWCRDSSHLDPQLRTAAVKIAAQQIAQLGCEPSSTVLAPCVKASDTQMAAVEHSSELLRTAQSNGALFLALPANGPARNSINEEGSLLHTLCQSSEVTSCRGPTAAQAEFRTTSGTLWRIGGVLLIAAGLLGMLLLLGFVAVRLLTSAVFSLLYLLLAPAMVLAPAFGDGGRALFRRWAARLLGSVVSKLVFSFLLGIVLAVNGILADLRALGWWTQWLLMSSFWWGAYAHRHQAVGLAEGALSHQRPAHERKPSQALVRRIGGAIESNQLLLAARRAKDRYRKPAPDIERRTHLERAAGALARASGEEQVLRTLAGERRAASEHAQNAPEITRRLSEKRTQLERLARERANAHAAGDRRRVAELAHRERRVGAEVEHEQGALNHARLHAGEGRRVSPNNGADGYSRERVDEQRRFLDAQAALPAAANARGADQRRDYAAMASLAGYQLGDYERLDPASQRAARLEIDRELALRRELGEAARDLSAQDVPRLDRRDRRDLAGKLDRTVQERMRDSGHRMPASRSQSARLDAWRREGLKRKSAAKHVPAPERSTVMEDAREVAARRKRQLGKDRP
jgi:TrbL/VirB6 plasmid conjugal transfer protein